MYEVADGCKFYIVITSQYPQREVGGPKAIRWNVLQSGHANKQHGRTREESASHNQFASSAAQHALNMSKKCWELRC